LCPVLHALRLGHCPSRRCRSVRQGAKFLGACGPLAAWRFSWNRVVPSCDDAIRRDTSGIYQCSGAFRAPWAADFSGRERPIHGQGHGRGSPRAPKGDQGSITGIRSFASGSQYVGPACSSEESHRQQTLIRPAPPPALAVSPFPPPSTFSRY